MSDFINEGSTHQDQYLWIKTKLLSALSISNHQPLSLKCSPRQFLYSLKLIHPKIREIFLITKWSISFGEQIEIKVMMMDAEDMHYSKPNPVISINDCVSELNRSTILGTYFTNTPTSYLLHYRSVLCQISHNFICASICEIIKQVEVHFINFAMKLGLFGSFSETVSCTIHQSLIRLHNLKMHYEIERQKRKKATKYYELSTYSIKIVNEALKIINCNFGELAKYKIMQGRLSKKKIQANSKEYNNILQRASVYQNIQQEKSLNYIVLGLEVKNKKSEVIMSSNGAFSNIYEGMYYVYTSVSITVQPQNGQKMRIQEGMRRLVRKEPLTEALNDPSYRNEIEFLKFIRSSKCKRIAQYYLTNIDEESKKHAYNIFINYYPANLFQKMSSMSQLSLFNAGIQILQGVSFLYSNKILHRDLKEENIMIDQQNNIRIIDFGSSCDMMTSMAEFKPNRPIFDRALCSTPTYFYKYDDIASSLSDQNYISKLYTREEYYQSHTFDVFSFGQILRNIFQLQLRSDSLTYRQVEYLANKCQQLNPDDRITPDEALVYLYEILNLYKKWNNFTGVKKSK